MDNPRERSLKIVVIHSGITDPRVISYRSRAFALAGQWARWGHKVALVIPSMAVRPAREAMEFPTGLEAWPIPFSDRKRNSLSGVTWELGKRCGAAFLQKAPWSADIIYSNTGALPDVVYGWVFNRRMSGSRWLVVLDNLVPRPWERLGNRLRYLVPWAAYRLSMALIRKADAVLFTSPLLEGSLRQMGFDSARLFSSRHGVDLAGFLDAKGQPGSAEQYDGVYIGRIHPDKGVFDLMTIWRDVIRKRPEARLAIAGTGLKDDVRRLIEQIREADLEGSVQYLGFISDREKARLLRAGRVFVFPSYHEANPVAVLEAMACELPVVAYDLPIFRERGNAFTLQTVAKGDALAFACRVLTLLGNPAACRAHGETGRRQSSGYEWETIAKEELRVFARLMSSPYRS